MKDTNRRLKLLFKTKMRLKWNVLTIKGNDVYGRNPTIPITLRTSCAQSSMVVETSCCGDAFQWQGLKKCSRLKKSWVAINKEHIPILKTTGLDQSQWNPSIIPIQSMIWVLSSSRTPVCSTNFILFKTQSRSMGTEGK